MSYIFFNGEIIPATERIAGARNRGLRYGDGVFETMKLLNGKIVLDAFHFERLFHGLQVLQFDIPTYLTPAWLSQATTALCRKNYLEASARIRLNVFRGNGSLSSTEGDATNVVIEAEALANGYTSFNEQGLVIDIYKEVKKSCDILSNLKSNNYLLYIMAAQFAKANELNDCLLLNSYDRICDASIANIFWIKEEQVFTPPLSEGGVAGVMRRFLVESIREAGFAMEERILTRQTILEADEVFLTNSLFGIRWVKKLREKTYSNTLSTKLYRQLIKPLHAI